MAVDQVVTRKQRREYERWRAATALTDEERAVGFPVVPGVGQTALPPRRQQRDSPETYGGLSTLRERLAHTRDPDEAARILGARRLAFVALGATGFAAAFTAMAVHFIAEVALGRAGAWSLAMLPAPVSVAAYSGVIAYGLWYRIATGRKWPRADRIGRIAGILNNTNVLPRRR